MKEAVATLVGESMAHFSTQDPAGRIPQSVLLRADKVNQ